MAENAASNASTHASMCSLLKTSGGSIRMTLPSSPPNPTRTFRLKSSCWNFAAASFAGSFVTRSFTKSRPRKRPTPLTSPIMGCLALSCSKRRLK